MENLIQEEKQRLTALLFSCNVSENRIKLLEPIIENVCFMKMKLDAAREAIKGSQVAISYNNGGGQTGIRENPLFKGYEALWKSYMSGMDKIISCLPAEAETNAVDADAQPKTVLDMIRARHAA